MAIVLRTSLTIGRLSSLPRWPACGRQTKAQAIEYVLAQERLRTGNQEYRRRNASAGAQEVEGVFNRHRVRLCRLIRERAPIASAG